jgi:hypothetical protein
MGIAECTFAAMIAWSPVAQHARLDHDASVTEARYRSIAASIDRGVSDPREPPLYAGAGGRAKTAFLVASLAFHESRFWARVDEGRCALRECDAGFAWSLWQVHPEDGIVLDGVTFVHARNRSPTWVLEHSAEVITGPQLIRDRDLAVRVVLHVARRSIRQWTTGVAAKRHAEAWWQRHPCTTLD